MLKKKPKRQHSSLLLTYHEIKAHESKELLRWLIPTCLENIANTTPSLLRSTPVLAAPIFPLALHQSWNFNTLSRGGGHLDTSSVWKDHQTKQPPNYLKLHPLSNVKLAPRGCPIGHSQYNNEPKIFNGPRCAPEFYHFSISKLTIKLHREQASKVSPTRTHG